ncbi:toxin-activating lysine-acyltransferase [Govanella unica]|uniref:RTX toxin-activating lysine-acyltransferase n=1 Tax=Govanella unica TaxID=2975056 RepID=A0A9X3TY42_9PROT|nr:toxin-activating lysine-acyltransferase [Govania unica]
MTANNPTVSHVFGELTWLLTQSPLHRHLKLADLEWLIMPPLLHRQFYVFRDGDKTIGVALWAKLSDAAQDKLNKPLLEAENRLTPDDWVSGENVWLIDLVAPFATPENRHREIMVADLISGPLKGQQFRLHKTDPQTGKREVVTVEADAGEKLKAVIEKAAAGLKDDKVH